MKYHHKFDNGVSAGVVDIKARAETFDTAPTESPVDSAGASPHERLAMMRSITAIKPHSATLQKARRS